jgi:hypothetical protein
MAATLPEFAQTGPSHRPDEEKTSSLLLKHEPRPGKVDYRPVAECEQRSNWPFSHRFSSRARCEEQLFRGIVAVVAKLTGRAGLCQGSGAG